MVKVVVAVMKETVEKMALVSVKSWITLKETNLATQTCIQSYILEGLFDSQIMGSRESGTPSRTFMINI